MTKKKNKPFTILFFSIFILVSLGIFWYSSDSFLSKRIQFSFRTVLLPISKTATNIGNSLSDYFSHTLSFPKLHEQYMFLQKENEILRAELKLYEQTQYENQRLKSLLGIYENNPDDYIPASVIFRDPLNGMNFFVNAGSHHLVKQNMAVVYPLLTSSLIQHFQLIGRTTNVGLYQTDVMSIYDALSHVSVRNLRNNDIGTLSYDHTKKILFIKFYEQDSFTKDDVVVVSSLSSLPNDLIVGSVQDIVPTESIYSHAIIATAIDLRKITEVLILP